MTQQQEKDIVYLMTFKRPSVERKHTNDADTCEILYEKYIKQFVRKDDRLFFTKKDDDTNECLFFIKKQFKL